jgi:hypothetical protein
MGRTSWLRIPYRDPGGEPAPGQDVLVFTPELFVHRTMPA